MCQFDSEDIALRLHCQVDMWGAFPLFSRQMTAGEKQDVFEVCLEKSGLFAGVGVATASTLMKLFGCMRSRLENTGGTEVDKRLFIAAVTKAIQDDPALARKRNADQKSELLKLMKAAFDNTSYNPPSSLMLAAEVNFLKAVHF